MERQQQPVKKREALKRLLMYVLKTGPAAFPLSLLGIIISAFSTVYGSLFIERLIDDYITPILKESTPNFTPLFRAIIMLGVIYLIGVVATYTYTLLMMILAQKVQKNIRDDMFKHIQYLPISYFDQSEYGDIMSRYTNDIDTLMQMISQSIPQFVNSTLSIIFVLGSMLILSWQLTIVTLVIFALAVGVVKYLTNKSGNYFEIQQRRLGELNGYNEEMLSVLKVIKVFSHEEFTKKDFEKYNEELRIASGSASVYTTVLFPIMGNIGNISCVLIALIGGVSAINGYLPLTLGAIASFLQLSRSFSMPIAQISQQLNSIVMALAGADRVFNLLDQEKEIDQGQVTVAPDRKVKGAWDWQVPSENAVKEVPVKGHISFKNVNFGYVPDKQILYNINLEAKPGMKVALVDETGAGKTTISSMINHFYEISSGQILYGGIDIKNTRKDDLHQSVAIVLQDTHMFTGTIMDNIRFGNPDTSDDDAYQAARLAHADEFIHELDDGYNTVIDGDGGGLSQEQMQLLSIARAMIADRPVVILDEATSSIDTRTERMVQQGMDNLLTDRTSFVITHRLSTIVNSDIICVLDRGHIIEAGNHQELLAKKGYYYELCTGKKEIE